MRQNRTFTEVEFNIVPPDVFVSDPGKQFLFCMSCLSPIKWCIYVNTFLFGPLKHPDIRNNPSPCATIKLVPGTTASQKGLERDPGSYSFQLIWSTPNLPLNIWPSRSLVLDVNICVTPFGRLSRFFSRKLSAEYSTWYSKRKETTNLRYSYQIFPRVYWYRGYSIHSCMAITKGFHSPCNHHSDQINTWPSIQAPCFIEWAMHLAGSVANAAVYPPNWATLKSSAAGQKSAGRVT